MRKTKHPLQRSINQTHGFTLVEVMIALVISSTLIGGVFSLYLNTKQTQNYTQSSSRIQESGRFSLEYLSRDIRMIGYRGCISYDDPIVNVIAKDMPAGFMANQNELVGFEIDSGWASGSIYENSTAITSKIKTGTDAFAIGRMASLSNKLSGNLTSVNAQVHIEATPAPNIKQNDLIFLSDCSDADIFRVTNNPNASGSTINLAHGNGSNTSNNLSKLFQDDSSIAKYQSTFYFVGDTGRDNALGHNVYALYQATNLFDSATPTHQVEELIEGVENMQLLYGEVLANGNTRYLTADNVTDMNQVQSIQLGLLITSQNQVRTTNDSKTYELPGESIGISTTVKHDKDKRLRHVFTTTVKIRNRALN
ncbi:PilW family protein [Psychrobium sp. 1_MG-2023]|uniref:PilW family protein n=1 Tax=Psychrobium sp. 1_MG-2023 TaxID=3062624 RepID=UPI000C342EF2|nr:PilW family protein [Psychrobium sp. 1_MG-2023]MDP2561852.1 PilW family protein [Psychrobium sp. 1_MG-2023]PKF55880.1 pilus assembly protein PilW [Alteromonadales bacterium alter-6D02]